MKTLREKENIFLTLSHLQMHFDLYAVDNFWNIMDKSEHLDERLSAKLFLCRNRSTSE